MRTSSLLTLAYSTLAQSQRFLIEVSSELYSLCGGLVGLKIRCKAYEWVFNGHGKTVVLQGCRMLSLTTVIVPPTLRLAS